jgi:hypothetical protein
MIGVDLKEFKRLGRLSIFVALGVFSAGRVGKDFCKALGMFLVHLVMLGFAHTVMLGDGWCGERGCGQGE